MCGASGQQTQLAGQQSNFYNTLQSSYAQNFGAQSAILSNLNSALQPIISGGPNQQGFSAGENAALTGSAINNAATANRNAQVVAGSNVGGNTGVTTGGQKQLQASIATGVGNNLSTNLNQINQANYATGRQNFFGAEQALGGVASQYNPTGYAGATNSAGGEAAQNFNEIAQENNQKWADIGGVVGGLGGIALNNWMKGKNNSNSNAGGGGDAEGGAG